MAKNGLKGYAYKKIFPPGCHRRVVSLSLILQEGSCVSRAALTFDLIISTSHFISFMDCSSSSCRSVSWSVYSTVWTSALSLHCAKSCLIRWTLWINSLWSSLKFCIERTWRGIIVLRKAAREAKRRRLVFCFVNRQCLANLERIWHQSILTYRQYHYLYTWIGIGCSLSRGWYAHCFRDRKDFNRNQVLKLGIRCSEAA